MKCKNCNNQLNKEDAFCPECGRKVSFGKYKQCLYLSAIPIFILFVLLIIWAMSSNYFSMFSEKKDIPIKNNPIPSSASINQTANPNSNEVKTETDTGATQIVDVDQDSDEINIGKVKIYSFEISESSIRFRMDGELITSSATSDLFPMGDFLSEYPNVSTSIGLGDDGNVWVLFTLNIDQPNTFQTIEGNISITYLGYGKLRLSGIEKPIILQKTKQTEEEVIPHTEVEINGRGYQIGSQFTAEKTILETKKVLTTVFDEIQLANKKGKDTKKARQVYEEANGLYWQAYAAWNTYQHFSEATDLARQSKRRGELARTYIPSEK